jgi:ParB family chromosome partitioning protein
MSQIQISQIKIGKRFRHEIGDITNLVESIQEVDLLHPIVIDESKNLVAGFRRLEACKKIGWKQVPYTMISIDDAIIGEFHENAVRKNFTASEIAEISDYVESTRIGHRPKKGSDSAPLPVGKTNDIVERFTGISHDTVNKIKKIKSFDRKLLSKIDVKEDTINRVYNKIIIQENKKLPKMKIPKGQYNLIIWDPSWPHDIEVAGGSGNSGNAQKYRPESIDEMMKKGLQKVLSKDAILGIWTLPTFHSEVLQVIKANGFEKIKTKIYWDKMVPSMGFNFRNSVEELCICVRGNVKAFWQTEQPNIIHQKREGPHSRKPDIFFEIMEKAANAGLPKHKLSKLEINSTKLREGWTTVGNQLPETSKYCKECNGCYHCYCGKGFCDINEYQQHRADSEVNRRMECA